MLLRNILFDSSISNQLDFPGEQNVKMMALSHSYATCIVSTSNDTQVVQCKNGIDSFNNKVYSMDSKKIVKLIAGENHFCALLEDSTECFGKNNSGQLGNGSTSHTSTKRRYFDDS